MSPFFEHLKIDIESYFSPTHRYADAMNFFSSQLQQHLKTIRACNNLFLRTIFKILFLKNEDTRSVETPRPILDKKCCKVSGTS